MKKKGNVYITLKQFVERNKTNVVYMTKQGQNKGVSKGSQTEG